jgi:hypothetical protein
MQLFFLYFYEAALLINNQLIAKLRHDLISKDRKNSKAHIPDLPEPEFCHLKRMNRCPLRNWMEKNFRACLVREPKKRQEYSEELNQKKEFICW